MSLTSLITVSLHGGDGVSFKCSKFIMNFRVIIFFGSMSIKTRRLLTVLEIEHRATSYQSKTVTARARWFKT